MFEGYTEDQMVQMFNDKFDELNQTKGFFARRKKKKYLDKLQKEIEDITDKPMMFNFDTERFELFDIEAFKKRISQ